MTVQEIADALNIPLGTIKSRLHHAFKTVREREHPPIQKWNPLLK